jgi:hypothetical protein
MAEIKIIVPTSLADITLDQYQRYLRIIENIEDGDMKESFISMKILEVFCNVPYSVASKFKVTDINEIVAKVTQILNTTEDLVKRFKIGDTEFGFIPKLDDMTFGEYIDLDQFLGDWQKMEKAMAVLYRPIVKSQGKLYDIKDYEGDLYHSAMKGMPLDAVFSSIVFFYRLGIDLSKTMMRYLEMEQVKEDSDLERVLTKNGDGITQFTTSLKEILDDLNISRL